MVNDYDYDVFISWIDIDRSWRSAAVVRRRNLGVNGGTATPSHVKPGRHPVDLAQPDHAAAREQSLARYQCW